MSTCHDNAWERKGRVKSVRTSVRGTRGEGGVFAKGGLDTGKKDYQGMCMNNMYTHTHTHTGPKDRDTRARAWT